MSATCRRSGSVSAQTENAIARLLGTSYRATGIPDRVARGAANAIRISRLAGRPGRLLVDRLQIPIQMKEPELVVIDDVGRWQQLLQEVAVSVIRHAEVVVVGHANRLPILEEDEAFGLVVRISPVEKVDDEMLRDGLDVVVGQIGEAQLLDRVPADQEASRAVCWIAHVRRIADVDEVDLFL